MLTRQQQRRGATIVEAAFVLPILLLLIFGIFEYGRFVMLTQVLENAAREGARYAIAHTADATTADVEAKIDQAMAGTQAQFSTGTYSRTVNGIVLRPQPGSGQTAGQSISWMSTTTTDGVVVEVTGTYKPILASFLRLPGTLPMRAKSVMYSEGN